MLQNPNPRPIWVIEGAPPLVGHARQRESARFSAPLLGFRPEKGSATSCLLPVARVAFRVIKRVVTTLTGGRLNAVSNASIDFLTKDNPFTSDRARRELGWSPAVRPEQGVPEAFRWWLTHQ